MKLRNRVLSLILCAAMLLSPAAALAQESAYMFSAGDMTSALISENYAAGEQINVTAQLGLELEESAAASEKAQALSSLLDQCTLSMSFYDDFGTGRIHAELLLGEASLVSADMLVFDDGAVQMMTSLTGKYVLTLPAGTFVDGMLNLSGEGETVLVDIMSDEFDALPLEDRLKQSVDDLTISLVSMLFGWVSQTQMERGDLYLTDNTYLDATDTRDAVAQRMVGKIRTTDFIRLLWHISVTLRDNHGKFQQALGDQLAELGVTRYQVHQLADTLFTQQTIDPAIDWTQPSTNILDDGTLCTKDDIRYIIVKAQKCIDELWREVTDNEMSMIVSYDDYGQTVGFDAVVPQICTSLPYEGFFNYSIKTDDDWQRLHTSHGELQVYDGNRIVGNLDIQFGEDVDGVNASHFKGYVDVCNQTDSTSTGFGVDAALTFSKGSGDNGETELFEGSAALNLRSNGEDTSVVAAAISGETSENENGFGVDATATLGAADMGMLIANLRIERADYEEIPFAGGMAIDLLSITDEQTETLTNEVLKQAAGLSLSLLTNPSALSDMMKLLGD